MPEHVAEHVKERENASATVPAPAHVIGRYALYGEIASGGMATVYFGRLIGPVGFSRTVAIKRLQPHFARDPEFVAMFLDEARLAARIRHPNVVPTLDVVATEGELFLVMEYVQGESLAQMLRAAVKLGEPVPVRIAASIVSGALLGLHAAHEACDEHGTPLHLVHRDVSPQNILVGADGVPRVLDFGVAKAVGRAQSTRDGQLKGKVAYMAPEQFSGEHVTRQADVYAASVVLWEALAARRLFRGDNEAIVLARVMKHEVVAPSRHRPGIPPALDQVALKGIATKPSERFGSAREMALALDKAAGAVSAIEMAEWVEKVAGPRLAARAQQIATIERSSMRLGGSAAPAEVDASPPVGSPTSGDDTTAGDSPMARPHPASTPPTAVTEPSGQDGNSAAHARRSAEADSSVLNSDTESRFARLLHTRIRRARMIVAGIVGAGLVLVGIVIAPARPNVTSAQGPPVAMRPAVTAVPVPPPPSAIAAPSTPGSTTASIASSASPPAAAVVAPNRGRASRTAPAKSASAFDAIGGRQ